MGVWAGGCFKRDSTRAWLLCLSLRGEFSSLDSHTWPCTWHVVDTWWEVSGQKKESGVELGARQPQLECRPFTGFGKTFHPLWILIPHLGNTGKSTFSRITVRSKRAIMALKALCRKAISAQAESAAVCGLRHAESCGSRGGTELPLGCRNGTSRTVLVAHPFICVVNIYGHLLCVRHCPRRWGCRDESPR